jgi:hypothetical protein
MANALNRGATSPIGHQDDTPTPDCGGSVKREIVEERVAGRPTSALQARMDATRQHVEVAHGVVAWAHAQEAGGKLTARRRSSWRGRPSGRCATTATNTSGSTTCSRAW